MEEKNATGAGPHKFLVQGRKSAELTGVKEVVSFDAKEVVLNTTMGALVIRGNELFVKRLTVEKGEVVALLERGVEQVVTLPVSTSRLRNKIQHTLFRKVGL